MNQITKVTRKALRQFLTMCAFVIAGFITIAAMAAETITYYHLDALGSPIAATDAQGNVIWRQHYAPYGERLDQPPAAVSNSRWYTGHPHDEETGLTYMGARYYDPIVGRFMGIDPKGFDERGPMSFNRYAYANNNPYKYIDPDGRAPNPAEAACVAGPNPVCIGGVAIDALTSLLTLGVTVWGLVNTDEQKLSPTPIYAKPPDNAYDPNGPKAPGKPGEAEGFKDPKGGENWVPNPNRGRGGASHGWEDDKGRVWVPTGQRPGRAHGGPHWDVQMPNGDRENVRPGQNLNDKLNEG